MTRLRKCAVCRRVAAISARREQERDEEARRCRARPGSSIRLLMFRSARVAIVRAALSETFEVSAASMRRRSTGSRGGDALAGGQAHRRRPAGARGTRSRSRSGRRRAGAPAGAGRAVVPLGRAGSVISSSSPLTAGAMPPFRSTRGALRRAPGRSPPDRPAWPAPREQDLVDVALGERPLAGGDLDDGGLVLRARGRPDREGDEQRRDERERDEDRGDRAPAARLEGPEACGLAVITGRRSSSAFPPGSGLPCCRRGHSGRARAGRGARRSCRAPGPRRPTNGSPPRRR